MARETHYLCRARATTRRPICATASKRCCCAGEQAEIILVDDGSAKDDTPPSATSTPPKYPTIVKAIHQENGGHGEGVNQGIRNATGLYYKVVDSDDWLDTDALEKVLAPPDTPWWPAAPPRT